MARLTKEQVASATLKFDEREVDMPELGGELLIRQMSPGARARLLDGLFDDDGTVTDLTEMQARMFAASVVEPSWTAEEVRGEIMAAWPVTMWDRVWRTINELNPNPQEVERAAAQSFRPGTNGSEGE